MYQGSKLCNNSQQSIIIKVNGIIFICTCYTEKIELRKLAQFNESGTQPLNVTTLKNILALYSELSSCYITAK